MKQGQHICLCCNSRFAGTLTRKISLSTFLEQLVFQIKYFVWRQILCTAIQGWT